MPPAGLGYKQFDPMGFTNGGVLRRCLKAVTPLPLRDRSPRPGGISRAPEGRGSVVECACCCTALLGARRAGRLWLVRDRPKSKRDLACRTQGTRRCPSIFVNVVIQPFVREVGQQAIE